jgi:hypothetical protein
LCLVVDISNWFLYHLIFPLFLGVLAFWPLLIVRNPGWSVQYFLCLYGNKETSWKCLPQDTKIQLLLDITSVISKLNLDPASVANNYSWSSILGAVSLFPD